MWDMNSHTVIKIKVNLSVEYEKNLENVIYLGLLVYWYPGIISSKSS